MNNHTIEAALAASLANISRRMEFWVQNKAELQNDIDFVMANWPTADLQVTEDNLDISITGSFGDLMGFIDHMEEDGRTVGGDLPEQTESYWSAYFYKEGSPRIWLSWSNKFCERVPVGTRMEEVTIYEVRCNG